MKQCDNHEKVLRSAILIFLLLLKITQPKSFKSHCTDARDKDRLCQLTADCECKCPAVSECLKVKIKKETGLYHRAMIHTKSTTNHLKLKLLELPSQEPIGLISVVLSHLAMACMQQTFNRSEKVTHYSFKLTKFRKKHEHCKYIYMPLLQHIVICVYLKSIH